MAVRPESLETPERDLSLRTREEAPPPVRKPSAFEELRALKEKIVALRQAPPPDAKPHCRDCFLRAVRATLDAIEG